MSDKLEIQNLGKEVEKTIMRARTREGSRRTSTFVSTCTILRLQLTLIPCILGLVRKFWAEGNLKKEKKYRTRRTQP